MSQTARADMSSAEAVSLQALGSPAKWFANWEGELRIEMRTAGVGSPAWLVEECIPSPRFNENCLRVWNRNQSHGFSASLQAIYRSIGQPTRVFGAIVAQLRRLISLRLGTAPLDGWPRLSEIVCRDAWRQLSPWLARHPTPLMVAMDEQATDKAGQEWQPVLKAVRQGLSQLSGTEQLTLAQHRTGTPTSGVLATTWYRFLAGFVAASQPLARSVDLILPIVPFGPAVESPVNKPAQAAY